jgi:triacylglycerol lipase
MRTPVGSKRMLLVAALAALGAACSDPQLTAPDSAVTSTDLKPQAPQATVVLMHGMGGFKNIGPLDYFFQVPEKWRAAGASLYVVADTPFASIEDRAAEVKRQLDGLAPIGGPLILVGHSQGGLDARYLVSKLGYANRVRALITIAAPHRGSPLADIALGLMPGPVEDALNALIGVLGWSLEGVNEISTSYMAQTFNPSVPDAPGVTYWSYGGMASPFALEDGSGWLHSPLFVTWSVLKSMHLDNDGIVPVDSQKWGQFQGMVPADHIGEVNQPIGDTPDFEALRFYGRMLQKMHDAGW